MMRNALELEKNIRWMLTNGNEKEFSRELDAEYDGRVIDSSMICNKKNRENSIYAFFLFISILFFFIFSFVC